MPLDREETRKTAAGLTANRYAVYELTTVEKRGY